MLKLLAKGFLKVGSKLDSLSKSNAVEKPDPTDYSTTDEPMEVPCQKEAYFFALNSYIHDEDKVLDVGCGIGYGLNILSIKAKAVYGVDVDQKAVKYVSSQLQGKNPKLKEVKHYDGYHLPYADKFFDVVTCIDVIEHVEDYDAFLEELLRVSKKTVVLDTPNRRPEYTNPDGTPKNYWHLREWKSDELQEILNGHNVSVDWRFINGSWEGPFSVTTKEEEDTLALLPVLKSK
jgi:2-polyprenyl-3-methyl-5-hydroxy-6-metoxy-1,4-benzoquinol methylase